MDIKNSIISKIYQEYYTQNNSPDDLISSYWKDSHKHYDVEIKNGEIQTIYGEERLGAMSRSVPKRLNAFADIAIHFFILPEKRELLNSIYVGHKVAKKMGMSFSLSCLRQVCSFNLCRSYSSSSP